MAAIRPKPILCLCLTVLALPVGLRAQVYLGSDAGFASNSGVPSPVTSGVGLDLYGGYHRGGWSLWGGGEMADGGRIGARLHGGKRAPLGPFTIGATAGFSYLTAENLGESTLGTGDLSLSWQRGGWGVWLGYGGAWGAGGNSPVPLPPGLEADSTSAPLESLDPSGFRGWVTGGAWRQLGNLVLSASLVSQRVRSQRWIQGGTPSDSLDQRDSTGVTGHERLADLELAASWYRGPVSLSILGGGRLAGASQLWGGVEGTLRLYGDLSLVARGGRRPDFSRQGIIGESYLFAGIRLSARPFQSRQASPIEPRANDFSLRRSPTGDYRISVRVPGARAVDVMGDATDWVPLALDPVTADQWVGMIELDPGLHRFVVRMDGGTWEVPPGLTAVDDEFFGEVGIVVVNQP